MSEENARTMTMLDQMIAQDSTEIMKAALPYVPASSRPFVSIFAKFIELQNTISLFNSPKKDMEICSAVETSIQPTEMLQDIRQFCNGPTKEKIDSLNNTLLMLQLFEMSKDSTP